MGLSYWKRMPRFSRLPHLFAVRPFQEALLALAVIVPHALSPCLIRHEAAIRPHAEPEARPGLGTVSKVPIPVDVDKLAARKLTKPGSIKRCHTGHGARVWINLVAQAFCRQQGLGCLLLVWQRFRQRRRLGRLVELGQERVKLPLGCFVASSAAAAVRCFSLWLQICLGKGCLILRWGRFRRAPQPAHSDRGKPQCTTEGK